MSDAVLACENVHKTFKDGKLEVRVLQGVNLQVNAGEMLAIVGTSGSGKSTLLHCLGGLDKPSSGLVQVAGLDINRANERKKGQLRNRYLGFVYQFHHLLPEFNALENVCMPLLLGGVKPKFAINKSRDLLDKVGLSEREVHRIGELSGGERQRVAIARALVNDPVCVLADEPTGNLDQQTAEHVFELMLNLNSDLQTSFIVVTHDMGIAGRMDRVLKLDNGVLSE